MLPGCIRNPRSTMESGRGDWDARASLAAPPEGEGRGPGGGFYDHMGRIISIGDQPLTWHPSLWGPITARTSGTCR